eukprot:CAMPEP_0194125714 /NCGR_PEP_ID=MMETSP0150-20130528/59609_1 /TAXON_ID=122233 /ORGANISM="Chaetoceros debilis, Strain MM31A-1" /LENGTH=144 /DNA_ID=CAMNT_0038819537 /DNA_START=244 /DNA_END=679 /DNA_ORIENTATION=+
MTTKRPHAAGMALADDISSSSAQISHGIVAKVPSFTPHPAELALADDISSSSAQISHGIVAKFQVSLVGENNAKMIAAVVLVQMLVMKTKSCRTSIHRALADELHIYEMCSERRLVKVSSTKILQLWLLQWSYCLIHRRKIHGE